MALADPQTFTYNGHAATLARTGMTANSSTYAGISTDGQFNLTLTQNPAGPKVRRSARLSFVRFVPDPIVPANNRVTENACTFVMETPTTGSSSLIDTAFGVAFATYLMADTNLLISQLAGGGV